MVHWDRKWLVNFNASKTKLLSFNHYRETFLYPPLHLHGGNLCSSCLLAGWAVITHHLVPNSLSLLLVDAAGCQCFFLVQTKRLQQRGLFFKHFQTYFINVFVNKHKIKWGLLHPIIGSPFRNMK